MDTTNNTFSDRISGNVAYNYFFTAGIPKNIKREDAVNRLKTTVSRNFKSYCFEDAPEAREETAFADIALAQGFLHGDGLPFPCYRILLKDVSLTRNDIHITDSAILLTYYHDANIAQISFNLRFENADTETLIFMRHMFGNGMKFHDGHGGDISLQELYAALLERLSLSGEDLEQSYLMEINQWGDWDNPQEIIEHHSRRLYGIMSGDEGWGYVPKKLAKERIQSQWSSRDFVRFIVFGNSFLLLNLNRGPYFQEYLAHQKDFGTTFYGGLNPYFAMDSAIAGVNHGILFALEMAMVTKTITDRTMNHHEAYQRSRTNDFSKDIRKTKDYRRELISTLNRVEHIAMTELGELERIVLDSQRITPVIEKVKYLLEMLESELDLMYQNRTNTLVTILTVAGLILSVIGVLYAHWDVFGL
ncbi:MAG: hypothetical protein U0M15_04810 [Bacillota bacterium]|nr:hypothetical protein [Bacillota bacterium]